MNLIQKIRELARQARDGRTPEPVIYYGPYDAIWPTVGVEGHCYFCHWCGGTANELTSLAQAERYAGIHADRHPEAKIEIVEAVLDPDEVSR